MSLSGSAARGALFTLGGQLLRFFLHVASLAVLARLLTPEDYGSISMILAIAGIATVLGDFGLSLAAIQAKDLSPAQRTNLFWINMLLGIGLTAVVFALSGPIAAFYNRPDLVGVTQIISLVFLLNAAAAQFRAEATRSLRFKGLAVVDVVSQGAAFVCALLAALAGWGYWALVTQQLTLALSTLLLLIAVARWWPGLPSRGAPLRSLMTFGVNTVGVQLINYASANFDTVMLGRVWGASVLGFYDRAYQLFRIPLQQIAAPMTRVALPILSRLVGTPRYLEFLMRAQLLVSYAFGGIFAVAIAFASPLITILLGTTWEQTVPLFQILAVGGFFQALGYVYYWVFLSLARTGLQLKFSIFTRAFMLGLIAVGVIWAGLGVAIAVALGLFLNWLVLTIWPMRMMSIPVGRLLASTLRPTVLWFVAAAVVLVERALLASVESLPLLVINVVTFVVIVGACWLFLPMYRRDGRLLIDTARALRRR